MDSIKDLFKNSKLWTALAVVIMFFTVLKGIRLPNMWSFSHYLFNYDYGFVKRGFIGEIISSIGIPFLQTYEFFCVFSFAILFANLALLFLIIKDLINDKNLIAIGISLIFASSLAIVFLSHSVGYFDEIGLLLTLIIIRVKKYNLKLIFASISLFLMVLIHEAQIVIFFPVIFMSLLLNLESSRNKIQLVGLFAISVLTMGILLYVNSAVLSQEFSNAMNLKMQNMTPQDIRDDAFWVLHRNAEDNLKLMSEHWHRSRRVMLFLSMMSVTSIFWGFFNYQTYQRIKIAKKNRLIILLSILAGLSPLVLNIFGWDWNRWTTLTITTSFLIYYLVTKKYPQKENVNISNKMIFVVIFLFFLSSISGIKLFDRFEIQLFPFIEHIEFFFDLL